MPTKLVKLTTTAEFRLRGCFGWLSHHRTFRLDLLSPKQMGPLFTFEMPGMQGHRRFQKELKGRRVGLSHMGPLFPSKSGIS